MKSEIPSIETLVEKFRHNLTEYKHPKYNETQARIEFINPFWEALGWDVLNASGYAMAFRDVIHEDEVKVGGTTKAPDYSFRIGGKRIFFMETKKPSIDLKHDPAPAFQLRRYAYSARLPVSLLTDFEEFIVYDTRLKPDITDKSHVGRMLYFTFDEYVENWDQIVSIFSKEAVLRGDFNRFIEDNQGKKSRAEIDRDFLNDLDEWRVHLARNIALRNPGLSERELNFAVQMTIDRLIFLRMAEDRGIESQYTLQTLLNGENIYPRLVEIYTRADERYNSGLFHFEEKDGPHPDVITPRLAMDDKVLKDVLSRLYYPACPYEFSVLPVEVLGNAYEQFLGKRISLTEGHRARIEEKPEVRKAGGVYYTPQYIVDYIVQNTVGKLLEGKTPKDAADLRICDPACGSGSFLLGAYQYLMDWHLKQYVAEHEKTGNLPSSPPARGQRPRKSDPQAIYQGPGGQWFLSTSEKKRILLNNLYGVDIDANAVEVTKLSLLLKTLENENSETLHSQMKLWHERALPNLSANIKCGNSLIGPDFYANQQAALFDETEAMRINAFDWQAEFKEVFDQGGFDAVIGNPPYVRQELLGDFKEYFQRIYKVYHGVADLYSYFIEKGISLLKPGGHFSYIVANKWMRANYGKPLRQWLKTQHLEEIVDFGDLPVFRTATTYPCIIKVIQDKPEETFKTVQMESLDFTDLSATVQGKAYLVDQKTLDDEGWSLSREDEQALLEKLKKQGVPLGDYVHGKIYRGVLTGLNEAFVISKEKRDELILEDPKSEEIIKPFLAGRDIKRYARLEADKYVIFTRRGIDIDRYPAVKKHLLNFKQRLAPRPNSFTGDWPGRKPGNYQWYEIQDTVDYFKEFETNKIIIPSIVKSASYTYDTEGIYSNDKTSIVPCEDLFLLGILNSKVADYFLHSIASTRAGGYFEYKPMYVSQIPIADNSEFHDQISSKVKQLLDLHKKLAEAREPRTREMLQRQIAATDTQIDQLVYALYNLTQEEIKIVEGE